MNNNYYDIELIEKYCFGLLKQDDHTNFERALREDENLAQKVAIFRNAHTGIENHGLKMKLKKFHIELEAENKNDSQGIYLRLIAASLTIILISSYLFWFFVQKKIDDYNLLSDQYFEPYEDVISTRGNDESIIYKSMTLYTQGNYSMAIEKFKNINPNSEYLLKIKFYTGICHLAINNTNEAIKCFSSISDDDIVHQSRWYLGLAYLKSNNKLKASETFSEISKEEFNYNKAQELLSILDK